MKRFILTLFLLSYLLLPKSVFAQDAISLGIYPPLIEINAVAPANIETNIRIQNLSESEVTLNPVFKPFKMAETYDGSLIYTNEDISVLLSKTKLYDLDMLIEEPVLLQPLEVRDFTLKIEIDSEQTNRDYYFSVIFESKPTAVQNTSAAVISGGIGTNVILSLGERNRPSGIIKLSAPFLLLNGPVPITMLLENKSSSYIKPYGTVSIYDMFGREAGRVDLYPQYVLASSSRFLKNNEQNGQAPGQQGSNPVIIWPQKFLFGLYTIKTQIKLSEKGPIFEPKAYFFAIPLYFVLFISAVAFISLGVFYRIRKRMKNQG